MKRKGKTLTDCQTYLNTILQDKPVLQKLLSVLQASVIFILTDYFCVDVTRWFSATLKFNYFSFLITTGWGIRLESISLFFNFNLYFLFLFLHFQSLTIPPGISINNHNTKLKLIFSFFSFCHFACHSSISKTQLNCP